MSDDLKPYSVHSFMLPFRWDYLPVGFDVDKQGKEAIPFEKRTDLNKFRELLVKSNEKWKRKFFMINGEAENFNEIHYFHAYAANTMFDLQQCDEVDENHIHESKVMVYLELDVEPDTDTYTIYIKEQKNDGTEQKKEYTLRIAGISLHIYNTGVAILTLNVENHNYVEKEHILYINEYGRRLYPQFLSDSYPATKAVKSTFLADKIMLNITGMDGLEDDFSEYDTVSDREVHHRVGNDFKRGSVVRVPKYIRCLFGENFCFIQQDEVEKMQLEKIRLNILTDDRMFFQCWYGSDEVASQLEIKTCENSFQKTLKGQYDTIKGMKEWSGSLITKKEKTHHQYLTDKFWHAYLFGDKNEPSIANMDMQKRITNTHTYSRWANYGTLYGFTRDSFVVVSQSIPTLIKNAPNLRTQMKTMYYQMAVLGLAQRASMLRFSAEVSLLADMTKTGKDKKLVENVKVLYQCYIEFVNKLNYREITPYIQGKEMYDQYRKVMGVQEDVKSLDGELNELFNYIKLREEEKQGDEAHNLTKVATWFLPASFIASLFGISFIRENTTLSGKMDNELWMVWGIIILGGILSSLLIFKLLKKQKDGR